MNLLSPPGHSWGGTGPAPAADDDAVADAVTEAVGVAVADAEPTPRPQDPRRQWPVLPLIGIVGVGLAVLAFTGGWRTGRLGLDGPGVALHLDLALQNWLASSRVPYWLSQMWNGTPVWAVAPSVSTTELVPLASLVGAEAAVRYATVGAQIAAGWGAYVLAVSLWGRRTPAAPVAGLVYALHPLLITHGALFGHEPSLWVLAATPWLAWSFRNVLRNVGGARQVALAGLIAAFSVIHQAEHAFALALMCGCMLAPAVTDAARQAGWAGVKPLLLRVVAAGAIALGCVAFWAVPFLSLGKSFLLTPPEEARISLTTGVGGSLGRNPGVWLSRSSGVSGVSTFEQFVNDLGHFDGLAKGAFYLSWVCLGLTAVTVGLLPRHDRDGNLSAILFASALSVWFSMAGVTLAASRSGAGAGEVVRLAVVGMLLGAVVWTFLRRLMPGRPLVAAAATVAAMLAAPYISPLLALQAVVPFLGNLRFPRFYPLAALGLSLGAAFPLVRAHAWFRERWPDRAQWLTIAAALAVVAVFFVDIAPYYGYYRLRQPDGTKAFQRVADELHPEDGDFRVAYLGYGDPRPSSELLSRGFVLSTGWPHPVASKEVGRLTRLILTPESIRNAALALSGTTYSALEVLSKDKTRVDHVDLTRNDKALPLVRAYDTVVGVRDETISAELALALATGNIGVVTGDAKALRALGDLSRGTVAADACRAAPAAPASTPGLQREVAMACALTRWAGVTDGAEYRPTAGGGALFRAPADGLRGIGVLLDRNDTEAELVLREVGPDGVVGAAVARATPGKAPSNDLIPYTFAPIPNSGGRQYAFTLSCERCDPDKEARLVVFGDERAPGDYIAEGRLDPDKVLAFSLIYDPIPIAPSSTTTVAGSENGRGSWRVTTSGTRASVVVVAVADFPGWEARIDGKKAPVLSVDGGFVGVVVPAGDHRLTLTWRKPAGWGLGVIITFATLVMAAFLVLRRPAPGAWGLGRARFVADLPPTAGAGLAVARRDGPARTRPERVVAPDRAPPVSRAERDQMRFGLLLSIVVGSVGLLAAVLVSNGPPGLLAAVILLAAFAAVVLLVHLLLAELVQPGLTALVLTVVFAASAIHADTAGAWTASYRRFAADALGLAMIVLYLRFCRTGRGSLLVGSAVALGTGLLFSPRAAMYAGFAVALRVLVLRPDESVRTSIVAVGREWRNWVVYWVPIGLGAAGAFLFVSGAGTGYHFAIGPIARHLAAAWFQGFGPSLLGGFVNGGALSGAEIALVALAQALLVGVVGLTIWRRRDAWRAWAFFVAAFVMTQAPVAVRPGNTSAALLAHQYRHYSATLVAFVIALAAAWSPVRAAPRVPPPAPAAMRRQVATAAMRRQVATSPFRRQMATSPFRRQMATAAVAVLCVVYVGCSAATSDRISAEHPRALHPNATSPAPPR